MRYFRSRTQQLPSSFSIFKIISLHFWLGDFVVMKFVLVKWMDSLFVSHQAFTFLSSEFIRNSRVVTLRELANILVSSTNILNRRGRLFRGRLTLIPD